MSITWLNICSTLVKISMEHKLQRIEASGVDATGASELAHVRGIDDQADQHGAREPGNLLGRAIPR